MNNRRKLIVALGAGALATPFASFAQQGRVWRVGLLTLSSRLDSDPAGAFPQAMRELGYIEGKNLVIEWRFADGKNERLPDMAVELVRLKMDLIVVQNQTVTLAAQKATTTIPIVMANSGDPVGSGFVKTLARPGGNITGLSNMVAEISAKHLEMLLSMVPNLSRVARKSRQLDHRRDTSERPGCGAESPRKYFAGGSTDGGGDREGIFRNGEGESRGRDCGAGCAFPPASAPHRRTGSQESATDDIRA